MCNVYSHYTVFNLCYFCYYIASFHIFHVWLVDSQMQNLWIGGANGMHIAFKKYCYV